jgi:hypothetical protein
MTEVLELTAACEAAAKAFAEDTAIDSIVYRIERTSMFPTPDLDGFAYAAFYKTPGWPATIWGVYADPDVAAMSVANRRAMT